MCSLHWVESSAYSNFLQNTNLNRILWMNNGWCLPLHSRERNFNKFTRRGNYLNGFKVVNNHSEKIREICCDRRDTKICAIFQAPYKNFLPIFFGKFPFIKIWLILFRKIYEKYSKFESFLSNECKHYQHCTIMYEDEEGDWITVRNDEEWEEGIRCWKAEGLKRMFRVKILTLNV